MKKKIVSARLQMPCESGCSKCGSNDVYRKYHTKGGWYRHNVSRWNFEDEYIVFCGHSASFKKECIVHHCRSCQYEWITPPMNSSTEELGDL